MEAKFGHTHVVGIPTAELLNDVANKALNLDHGKEFRSLSMTTLGFENNGKSHLKVARRQHFPLCVQFPS